MSKHSLIATLDRAEPRRPYCVVGWQPCGCMGIAAWIDLNSTPAEKRSLERKIKHRGYRREVYQDPKTAPPFECPEHKALRMRMTAEKKQQEYA